MKIKWSVLIILIISITRLINAQSKNHEEPLSNAERMEELFIEWDRLNRPGGSVVVVKDGEVLFKESYGLASLDFPIKNTEKTIYDITSIAEQFTAKAITMLESKGSLSNNNSIKKYFPELSDSMQPVTIGHLLNHTSGLWDWKIAYQLSGGYLENVITFEQILKLIQQQQILEFEPGTQFKYSTTNYILLAEIVKRVTGQSFPDWVWEHIFRPNKMLRTTIMDRYGEPIENCAEAYDYLPLRGYQKGTRNLSAPGSHCMFSSINDMTKWLINLVSRGTGLKKHIEKMLNPEILNNSKKIQYSNGFYIDSYKGLKRYKAQGHWQGFNCAFHYFPEEKFGVIILCNWTSGWVRPVSQATQVTDIYLEEYFPTLKEPTPPEDTKKSEFKPDPEKFDQFIGDYRRAPGQIFAIVREKNQILCQFSPRNKYKLSQLTENKFKLTGYDYFFTFKKDVNGNIINCLIQYENDDIIAPKIEIMSPSQDQLIEYMGDYYSKELDTRYSIMLEDKKLILSHRKLKTIILEPEAKDHFTSGSRLFRLVEFERETEGVISGFKIKNLNFIFSKVN
jgi:CubicO group peptidase (beta-lactamase class C family)